MAQHANQPLPRLSLLVAERAAHVGEHQQSVRQTVLPEHPAPHFPAASAAGKGQRIDARRVAGKRASETQTRRVAAEQLLRCTAEQRRAAAVYEPEGVGGVEREDGDVDLLHHAAEQRGRLEGAEPLRPEIVAQAVQLEEQQPERVFGIRPASPQRVVALAQRGEHVRHGLQGPHDLLPHDGRAGEPNSRDDECQCPLGARREVTEPEESERERERWNSTQQREPEYALLVSLTALRGHAV